MKPERTMRSPYMEWAKLHSAARYNLATSGILSYPLAKLPVKLSDLEINGPDVYGYRPLRERLALKSGVPGDCVVMATGTSMANHLAMAAVLEAGDEVLIEEPTYELLVSAAKYLGATVRSFPRPFEDEFRVDPDEVKRRLTPRTRLIVLTNLHNPSGAFTDERTLQQIGDMVAGTGTRVLVDEVYLEAVFDRPLRSAFQLGPQFVVTSSLTKGYGLSGLRCGWILAEPALVERIWRLNDLFAATPAHPAELLSVIALDNLERIGERAKSILEANRKRFDELLGTGGKLALFRPQHGTVLFPRLRQGSVEEFCRRLREQHETSVVPGSFFGAPQHFRIGLGGDPTMTGEGLKRMARLLDSWPN